MTFLRIPRYKTVFKTGQKDEVVVMQSLCATPYILLNELS